MCSYLTFSVRIQTNLTFVGHLKDEKGKMWAKTAGEMKQDTGNTRRRCGGLKKGRNNNGLQENSNLPTKSRGAHGGRPQDQPTCSEYARQYTNDTHSSI